MFVARFSEAGMQRCNLYCSVPVNFPKLEGDEDSYPELGRSSTAQRFTVMHSLIFFVRLA